MAPAGAAVIVTAGSGKSVFESPQLIKLDGVVYARYYAEGVVGTDGNVSPYRTRVTSVWLKESDGEWRVKSMHFSPANYGGTHKTQSSDFDD